MTEFSFCAPVLHVCVYALPLADIQRVGDVNALPRAAFRERPSLMMFVLVTQDKALHWTRDQKAPFHTDETETLRQRFAVSLPGPLKEGVLVAVVNQWVDELVRDSPSMRNWKYHPAELQ